MAKILLVEDNEDNRDMLKRRLERKGYEVLIALDGQEGVDKAANESPDLILMDMSLPVLDGWEATERIKTNPATQAIPVIALTAHAMAETGKKRWPQDATTTTPSRWNCPALLDKIAALLERKGSA